MSNATSHFEVSKVIVYKVIGILLIAIVTLCLYVYQGDEQATKESFRITRVQLKTNQQAIQRTLDGMIENDKQISIGKVRMDGHEVNTSAHTN